MQAGGGGFLFQYFARGLHFFQVARAGGGGGLALALALTLALALFHVSPLGGGGGGGGGGQVARAGGGLALALALALALFHVFPLAFFRRWWWWAGRPVGLSPASPAPVRACSYFATFCEIMQAKKSEQCIFFATY